MSHELLEATLVTMRRNKDWAEKAIAQTSDQNMHRTLSDDTNSIVVIMKHVSGNLQSRWTDFLTTDGEKDWRDRDNEFVDDFESREQLMDYWNKGWDCFLGTLDSLNENDLGKEVFIRGEPHSVRLAIQRSVGHTCYHVGQIILLARIMFEGKNWNTISIPKGGSNQYNQSVWGKTHFKK